MAKPLAVLFADSHHGGGWASRQILGDDEYALEQIAAGARRHEVSWVIGAGDIIDKQRNRSRMTWLFHWIDRLAYTNIAFGFIQGNHDFDEPPWLAGHSWARHLHHKNIDVDGYQVYGLDFQPSEALRAELDDIPRDTDMLICHQSWTEWMGGITLPQGSLVDIPGVSYVFSGDFHHFMLRELRGGDGQSMTVCSPGATHRQEIAEPDEHFYVLFDDAGNFTKQPLKSRQKVTAPILIRPEDLEAFVGDLDGALGRAEQKALADDLPESLRKPLLHVTFSHRLNDAVRRIERLAGGRAHIFWKQLPKEANASTANDAIRAALKARQDGKALTPLSMLDSVVKKDEDPAVYALCERLLLTNDPKLELANWKTEQLAEPVTALED